MIKKVSTMREEEFVNRSKRVKIGKEEVEEAEDGEIRIE